MKEKAEKKNTKTIAQKEESKKKNTKAIAKKEESKKKNTKAIAQKEESKKKNTKAIAKKEVSKKKNTKTITKKEETQKDNTKEKTKKTERRYIEISVGLLIAIIIIIALVILNIKLGKRAYNVVTEKKNINASTEPTNISVSQEIGNELNNQNELLKKMAQKITFTPNVTASIYNVEEFNLETIPNDLKLRLAWANTKSEDRLTAINENGQEIESIEKSTMEQSMKRTFGIDINYQDESFTNTDIIAFSTYAINQGTINYENDLYTSTIMQYDEKTEAEVPIIYQEVEKVIKYSKKIEIYVDVSYINPENERYSVYKNFKDGKFSEKLMETTKKELFEDFCINIYTGEGTVTTEQNVNLNGIRSQLNTYKYTFMLNQATGEYYLTEFEKN